MSPTEFDATPAESFAEAILSSSDDAIIVLDLEGMVLRWNPAAERIYGYDQDEMVGSRLTRLLPPDRTDEHAAHLERIATGETVDHYETVRLRKDGSPVAVAITTSPVRDEDGTIVAASTIARDISVRRRAERDRLRLAAIVESSEDAIIGKELDGTITSWNMGAEELYGWSEEEAIGRHISLIVPEEKREELDGIMERMSRGERVEPFETIRTTKDGRNFPVSLTVSPIRGRDGEVLGAAAIGRDLSARNEAEEALRTAMERAEAASRAKGRFLATMSHELRTPLNVILGYTSLLRDQVSGPVNEKQAKHLTRIEAGAVHLISLIDNILAYTRAEAGREMLRTEAVDLRELAGETLDLLRPQAEGKGLELGMDLPEDSVTVRTDPGKVRQILLNLMGNAVKFTREGEVDVGMRRVPDGGAEIEVRDTGPGIPEEARERIFHPFLQLDGSVTRSHEGSGLGLTVSRRLARLLGGDLTLSSRPGSGSAFTLHLPREAPERAGAEPEA